MASLGDSKEVGVAGTQRVKGRIFRDELRDVEGSQRDLEGQCKPLNFTLSKAESC